MVNTSASLLFYYEGSVAVYHRGHYYLKGLFLRKDLTTQTEFYIHTRYFIIF